MRLKQRTQRLGWRNLGWQHSDSRARRPSASDPSPVRSSEGAGWSGSPSWRAPKVDDEDRSGPSPVRQQPRLRPRACSRRWREEPQAGVERRAAWATAWAREPTCENRAAGASSSVPTARGRSSTPSTGRCPWHSTGRIDRRRCLTRSFQLAWGVTGTVDEGSHFYPCAVETVKAPGEPFCLGSTNVRESRRDVIGPGFAPQSKNDEVFAAIDGNGAEIS